MTAFSKNTIICIFTATAFPMAAMAGSPENSPGETTKTAVENAKVISTETGQQAENIQSQPKIIYDHKTIEKAWLCSPIVHANGFKSKNPQDVLFLLNRILDLQECRSIPSEEIRKFRRALLNEYFSFNLIAEKGEQSSEESRSLLKNAKFDEIITYQKENERWLSIEGYRVTLEIDSDAYYREVAIKAKEKQIIAQQEKERERQAKAAKAAELKSGRAKPANLGEAAILYDAQPGGRLASAPKIRPDGKMYYMHGKIKMAGNQPEFFAALAPSQENELLADTLRKARGMGESTDYFSVVIPKRLQHYYFDEAKIEGGFDLVGRYISNTKYKTVSGQEKSAPVFEAVYLVMWK